MRRDFFEKGVSLAELIAALGEPIDEPADVSNAVTARIVFTASDGRTWSDDGAPRAPMKTWDCLKFEPTWRAILDLGTRADFGDSHSDFSRVFSLAVNLHVRTVCRAEYEAGSWCITFPCVKHLMIYLAFDRDQFR